MLLLCCAIACEPPLTGASPSTPARPSSIVTAYLGAAVDIMQARSLHRQQIDWSSLRQRVASAAGNAQTIADVLPAIRSAIELLGDGHSFYRSAAGQIVAVPRRSCSAPRAISPEIPIGVGYVRVSTFSGEGAEGVAHATALQAMVREMDRPGLTGWIIDLRGNMGGNMWPMIAGVGPILGNGIAGHFVGPEGIENTWGYRDGVAFADNTVLVRVASAYRVREPELPVAVLLDNWTASSGEATAIAFKARPNTRFFGTPTCGLSTANTGFRLSDGAWLFLTTSLMSDRTLRTYGEQVLPDEFIEDQGALFARAVSWLRGAR